MDLLFSTLAGLFSDIKPTAALLVLALMALTVLTTSRVIIYLQKKKTSKGIFGLLSGQANPSVAEEITLLDIQKKMEVLLLIVDTLSTTQIVNANTEKIIDVLDEIRASVIRNSVENEKHYLLSDESRTEILKQFTIMLTEFSDIKHFIKLNDAHLQQDSDSAKELMNRIHGILVRAISQIEKTDEFMRTTVPEFRSYHKEISNDVSDLSRDVALVERSLQNQINNSQQITLR